MTRHMCCVVISAGGQLPAGCWEEVLEVLKVVEKEMGAALGDTVNPLLLSVRSGAAVSLSQLARHMFNL